jgi:hypothetical protein
MTKKKILIISRSFYPMNSPRSFRTTELVKEFARQGHKVTLLTYKDSEIHAPFEKEHGVIIKHLGSRKFKEIEISKGNRYTILLKRGARRLLNLAIEYPDIELMFKVKRALKKEAGYDLLISIAVPHPIHWGVAWAWDRNNNIAKTWIADCGDPYIWATLDSFNKLFYFRFFEKNFCKKADFITVPIESAKEGYYPEYRDKIEVIPQGFNFDEIKIDPSTYKKNEIPTFAYAGGFIPGGRDPREFLSYIVELKHKFKFIIYTKDEGLIRPYIDKARGRIEVRGYVPREQLLKELSRMDFLINFENRSSLMMPSKLIDYHLTNRPVLSVSSNDINKAEIDQFLEGVYSEKVKFDNVEQYRIQNVCKEFLKLSER